MLPIFRLARAVGGQPSTQPVFPSVTPAADATPAGTPTPIVRASNTPGVPAPQAATGVPEKLPATATPQYEQALQAHVRRMLSLYQ